ncbi:hypothetical protein [Bacillus toyonensis]|uniref:hypothetical protein n=1 Tax=Bacillus toyonensis TaxID=155322 RepID=UPI002E1DC346|nr:hypothetical protein [Bacillus toyonensis]
MGQVELLYEKTGIYALVPPYKADFEYVVSMLLKEERVVDFRKEETQNLILSSFCHKVEGFFLKEWERFFPVSETVSEETKALIEDLLHAVAIKYSSDSGEHFCKTQESYIASRGRSNTYLERDDVLEIIIPSWEAVKYFIEENQRKEYIVSCLSKEVCRIVSEADYTPRLLEVLIKVIKPMYEERKKRI